MPRIKIEKSTEMSRLCDEIEAFLLNNMMSQNKLSKETGVPQYQISRILTGRTKTITSHVKALCSYANIKPITGITFPCDNSRLQLAVGKVWDGSESSANLVAMVIEALEPFIKHLQASHSAQSRRQ